MEFNKFRDKFNKYFAIYMGLLLYVAVIALAIIGGAFTVLYWGKDFIIVIMSIPMCIIMFSVFIYLLVNYDIVFGSRGN